MDGHRRRPFFHPAVILHQAVGERRRLAVGFHAAEVEGQKGLAHVDGFPGGGEIRVVFLRRPVVLVAESEIEWERGDQGDRYEV